MEKSLDFSIITPSYNMLDYLRRCSASIADQDQVSLEHIVVDGGSRDGTVEWLHQNRDVISISEKDDGMYDAINKGLSIAQGSICAYLNCDEQYLQGTLKAVKECFEQRPTVDVVFGNTLYVRPDGALVAFRKATQPRWYYILANSLYIMSCSTFFRRRVFESGYLFDKSYREAADADLVVRLLRKGYRFSHLRRYLAAFTITDANAMLSLHCRMETERMFRSAPRWVRIFRVPLNLLRIAEKALSGAYFQSMPLEYAIYTSDVLNRTLFRVHSASPVVLWH